MAGWSIIGCIVVTGGYIRCGPVDGGAVFYRIANHCVRQPNPQGYRFGEGIARWHHGKCIASASDLICHSCWCAAPAGGTTLDCCAVGKSV